MRSNKRHLKIILGGSVIASAAGSSAQAPTIVLSTPAARSSTVSRLSAIDARRREAAREWAARNHVPMTVVEKSGRVRVLARIDAEGFPEFLGTDNKNAAISTGANLIRNTAPYNVNGSTVRVGLWEAGAVPRWTHQDFVGAALIQASGQTTLRGTHATHVAGTIVSQGNVTYDVSGVPTIAMGMAPGCTLIGYDSDNATAEMGAIAATTQNSPTGIQLSNHSYGRLAGWDNYDFDDDNNPGTPDVTYRAFYGPALAAESRYFGNYNSDAVSEDTVAFAAPYYLVCRSAANDRGDAPPANGQSFVFFDSSGNNPTLATYNSSIHPGADGGATGYDTIPTRAICKNILTVGAANDAVSGGIRNVSVGTIASFSSCGPADDGRIKPDIVANGISLVSADNDTDTAYAILSGTSMSGPNACGSAALLVQHWRNKFPGTDMRSSTLKALIIHTADDLGNAGPDYRYGYGYMNAKLAADTITAHSVAPSLHIMQEGTLVTNSEVDSIQVTSDGVTPLRATLCWTDPPGVATTTLDNTSPRLINNLDLKIIDPSTTTRYPFKLDVNNPANLATATGANNVDNVEQVLIAAPAAGVHTIKVSMTGTLTSGPQNYSLIITGQSPAAAVTDWTHYN